MQPSHMGQAGGIWALSNLFVGTRAITEFYLYAGVLLLGCSSAIHYFLYLRLRDTGRNYIMFNWLWPVLADYLGVRSKYGWSPWPVYLVLLTMVVGLVLLCVGVFRL